MRTSYSFLLSLGLAVALPLSATGDERELRWWKGNLHTHSLWSDGDEFPELIADWYKNNDYNFLAFTDHNVVLKGERWVNLNHGDSAAQAMPIAVGGGPGGGSAVGRSRHAKRALPGYLERFGPAWVEQRIEGEDHLIRLKPLSEFRHLFEEPERFMLMMGEEITDRLVVHVNAIHLSNYIPTQGGDTVLEVIQRNMDAVQAQREETGQNMFPFLNHPNFQWAITAEDLAGVKGARFFEVYNGHLGVNNPGDERRAGTERIWDVVLTLWHSAGGLHPIYGLATDDGHHYRPDSSLVARPGRGWVMVRARWLTPDHIIRSMEAGDFYSSTGVVLRDIRQAGDRIDIEIEPEEGVTYRTEFIGTRVGFDADSEPVLDAEGKPMRTTQRYSEDVGKVLKDVEGSNPSYSFEGDEYYVRAKVISSKQKQDPTSDSVLDFEVAWTQPVVGPAGKANAEVVSAERAEK